MTTASVEKRDFSPGRRQVSFDTHAQRDRSKSPAFEDRKRPTFNERRGQPTESNQERTNDYRSYGRSQNQGQTPPRFQNEQQPRSNGFQTAMRSPYQVRRNFSQNQQQQTACLRCGATRAHANPMYCPMITRNCFSCGEKGHSSKMCHARQNSNQQH